ncbi:hypothetical protein BDN72DRAFT_895535 [Pluteus cervinus]|uniref:Uncharacterized protein n=1 Tax=Pluteus cervinus TaxID=181527 RepID=A0ACD3B0V4_9AGAR|nr:hypothetical protein BDN72DRAFT_895535 [Pluteus cervinus]
MSASHSSSIFQPRETDKCTWVSETEFFDIDDELEEADVTIEDLRAGYDTIAKAFAEAHIPFAAIGGLAFTLLGARPDYLTHDVDFQIHTTPLKLFEKLRTMENVRLKTGLQADNFRIHCQIVKDKWIGVDFLMTNNPVGSQAQKFEGYQVLQITPLLQSKLKSYFAREAERDKSDILFLIEKHSDKINTGVLDGDQVEFFLNGLSGAVLEMSRKVLQV